MGVKPALYQQKEIALETLKFFVSFNCFFCVNILSYFNKTKKTLIIFKKEENFMDPTNYNDQIKYLIDPLSGKVMRNPVTLKPCNHNIDEESLKKIDRICPHNICKNVISGHSSNMFLKDIPEIMEKKQVEILTDKLKEIKMYFDTDEKLYLQNAIEVLSKASELTKHQENFLEGILEKGSLSYYLQYGKSNVQKLFPTPVPLNSNKTVISPVPTSLVNTTTVNKKEALTVLLKQALQSKLMDDEQEKEYLEAVTQVLLKASELTIDQQYFLEDIQRLGYFKIDDYTRKRFLKNLFLSPKSNKTVIAQVPSSTVKTTGVNKREALMGILKQALQSKLMDDPREQSILEDALKELSKAKELSNNQQWLLQALQKSNDYFAWENNSTRKIYLKTVFS